MNLVNLALLYTAVGAGAAIALALRRGSGTAARLLDCALVLCLWPIYGPFLLARLDGRDSIHPAAATDFLATLRRAARSPLGALLPDHETALALARRLETAQQRVVEIEELSARPEFQLDRAEAHLVELRQRGASPAALASAGGRLENLCRLGELRLRFARELEEVAELLHQLTTQAELVRLAGASDSCSGEIVRELVARVEGLDQILAEEPLG